jgi:hypothetical protein
MYDQTSKGKEILIGVISIETDDLLGGGIGTKWDTSIEKLRKKFEFGRWEKPHGSLARIRRPYYPTTPGQWFPSCHGALAQQERLRRFHLAEDAPPTWNPAQIRKRSLECVD